MLLLAALSLVATSSAATDYTKIEYQIPMRDGVKLYTAVYVPKSMPGKHPILMERTCYSAGPYGKEMARFSGSRKFQDAGYIFAFQDVRGTYMSGGEFVNIRPQLKPGEKGIDESTDAFDTIDYLVKHVPANNGSVGLWGISYPGFYAAAGAINSHPALKAVSPQAPVSDWFVGDDVHHNGAFFIQDNFDFSIGFDVPRKGLETDHQGIELDRKGKSAYDFFLEAGTGEGLEKRYFKGRSPYWNELLDHPNLDAYWQARSLPGKMKNVKCAVLTVGGWFDAEDQWGALNLYRSVEDRNSGIPNTLVMGPWSHGMWAYGAGDTFGQLKFGMPTSEWFRENVEFPFFDRYLRGTNLKVAAEALVFETGGNQWREFPVWPPRTEASRWYLQSGKALADTKPNESAGDTYVNDPASPTPYIPDYKTSKNRPSTYMVEDQRFAEARDDVVTYRSAPLSADMLAAGPIDVDLWVKTTGTDGDFVVKVIDTWPDDTTATGVSGKSMAGYEELVRGDIMRGRFRESFVSPKAFVPGAPSRIHFKLNDVLHRFKAGHRLMVQVQSSWFPLVDRNPNQFMDTYRAKPEEFQRATVTVLHDPAHPSSVTFGALKL